MAGAKDAYLPKLWEGDLCPLCRSFGRKSKLRFYYLNLQVAALMCKHPQCSYPLYTKYPDVFVHVDKFGNIIPGSQCENPGPSEDQESSDESLELSDISGDEMCIPGEDLEIENIMIHSLDTAEELLMHDLSICDIDYHSDESSTDEGPKSGSKSLEPNNQMSLCNSILFDTEKVILPSEWNKKLQIFPANNERAGVYTVSPSTSSATECFGPTKTSDNRALQAESTDLKKESTERGKNSDKEEVPTDNRLICGMNSLTVRELECSTPISEMFVHPNTRETRLTTSQQSEDDCVDLTFGERIKRQLSGRKLKCNKKNVDSIKDIEVTCDEKEIVPVTNKGQKEMSTSGAHGIDKYENYSNLPSKAKRENILKIKEKVSDGEANPNNEVHVTFEGIEGMHNHNCSDHKSVPVIERGGRKKKRGGRGRKRR